MDRRLFLKHSISVVGGAVMAQSLIACAILPNEQAEARELESDDDALRTKCTQAPVAAIGANHGHKLVVTLAEANAAVAKVYSIKGTSGHPHTVSISAAQFKQLGAGAVLQINSSTDAGHKHLVKVSCA